MDKERSVEFVREYEKFMLVGADEEVNYFQVWRFGNWIFQKNLDTGANEWIWRPKPREDSKFVTITQERSSTTGLDVRRAL